MTKIHEQAEILADSAWEEVVATLYEEECFFDIECYESLLKLNFANAFIIDLKKIKATE